MKNLSWLAFIALPIASISPASAGNSASTPTPSKTASSTQGAVRSLPKIHIVDVVDESGCKKLKGGLATGGGILLGGGLAAKAGLGAGGILAAGMAGEQLGGAKDKSDRCRQTINIDATAPRS